MVYTSPHELLWISAYLEDQDCLSIRGYLRSRPQRRFSRPQFFRLRTSPALISGVIQDAQGAVVPGAKVTLINDAQGAGSARSVMTSPEGNFVFSPVLAGKVHGQGGDDGLQEI